MEFSASRCELHLPPGIYFAATCSAIFTNTQIIGALFAAVYRVKSHVATHAGRISHEAALAKAEAEFEKFRRLEVAKPPRVDKDFEEAIKKLPAPKPTKPAKKKK
jgi:hypothetical protein